MDKIFKWYYAWKAENALREIKRLERHKDFISEFFCGETAYPIELKKWEQDLEKAKKEFKKYKKYL